MLLIWLFCRIFADYDMKYSVFLAFSFINLCFALIDLNIHELQYISDHLTYQECCRLSAALYLQTWDLPGNITGSSEPVAPCLMLLLRYDRGLGRGKTFHDLARRIKQIGRTDIAQKLSQMVMHKRAEAIQKDFLDDPFQKMIGVTPYLLDNSPDNSEDDIAKKEEDEDSRVSSEELEVPENPLPNNSSKWFPEFITGLSSFQITLIQVALLSFLLLLITFCIFGCPWFIEKCSECCMPRPLAECIKNIYNFIRVDLVDYFREVC